MNIATTHLPQAKRLLLLSPAGLGMIAAACGYGGAYGGGSSASAPPAPSTTSVASRSSDLGKILTDAQGRTLYLFTKDTTAASSCAGTCSSVWPPLGGNGGAQAAAGVSAALLGTTVGRSQVTYNGHPLYYYVGDSKAGDTNGQDLNQFGGSWYVVSPAGAQVGG